MPIIRPISDLRNHADQISDVCHKWQEPVYITKNGKSDLVVMSHAYFDHQQAMLNLYRKLDESEADFRKKPKGIPHEKVMHELRKKFPPK